MNFGIIKKIVFTTILLTVGHFLYAQQEAQYSMYMMNTLAVNPGYAGSREALNITLLNRNQWMGFKGAPVTQTVSVHTPIFSQSLGLGLSYVHDQIGPVNSNSFYVDLAYRIRFKKSKLSLGVKAGGDLYKANLNTVTIINENDQTFTNNINTGILPNFGAGFYHYSDRHYFGLSVPRSLSNKILKVNNQNRSVESKQQMHYYLIGGYVFGISEMLKFKPSYQVKVTQGAPIVADINASFILKERLFLGAFFRTTQSLGMTLQFNFTDQFRTGFAYEHSFSKISWYNNGSLELCLSYDFKYKKDNIKSPRYF